MGVKLDRLRQNCFSFPPLNFPAIFLFFWLRAELWSDWTYCVSATAHKYRGCWSSLLPHRWASSLFVPKWDVQGLKQNYSYSLKKKKNDGSEFKQFKKLFAEWQESEFLGGRGQDANRWINTFFFFARAVTSFKKRMLPINFLRLEKRVTFNRTVWIFSLCQWIWGFVFIPSLISDVSQFGKLSERGYLPS